MPTSPYFTSADASLYLKDVSTPPNAKTFDFFAAVLSDWFDEATGQYFFADGYETKWFDAGDIWQQGNELDLGLHPCYGKIGNFAALSAGSTGPVKYTPYRGPVPANGDVLTLGVATTQENLTVSGPPVDNGDGTYNISFTTGTRFAHLANESSTNINVQLAYFENQPSANWILNISGDGVRPPSNYFMWPRNPKPYQSGDPTSRKPWTAIHIAHIPISATTYLPTPIPGYLTIGVGSNWGWPAVPYVVKDFIGRTTIKMWRARGAGWAEQLGGKEVGQVQHVLTELGALDEFTLLASSFKKTRL